MELKTLFMHELIASSLPYYRVIRNKGKHLFLFSFLLNYIAHHGDTSVPRDSANNVILLGLSGWCQRTPAAYLHHLFKMSTVFAEAQLGYVGLYH